MFFLQCRNYDIIVNMRFEGDVQAAHLQRMG